MPAQPLAPPEGMMRPLVEPAAELSTEEIGRYSRHLLLPEVARKRLGIRPGQVNLLVRMVLRALDRTMTDRDANLLRDRIYRAVHAGDCPSSHVGLAHDECAGADS